MAANYFVVINRQAYESDAQVAAVPKASCKVFGPGLESAKFFKVESAAGTVAEAQELARLAYPGLATGTPIVVTEAAWKES
jgi:hypothetical protein